MLSRYFPSVAVVEERRVEAAAVEVNGIRPLAVDSRAGHQVVVRVPQGGARAAALCGASVTFDVGVDQVEEAVGVAEARRPDAAGIRVAEHVELAGASERAGQQAPMDQVARVVDLHSRIPFEGRGGDVVVVADADDRRVGIETGKDRVADSRSCVGHVQILSGVVRSRTRDHKTTAPTRSSTPRQMKNGV